MSPSAASTSNKLRAGYAARRVLIGRGGGGLEFFSAGRGVVARSPRPVDGRGCRPGDGATSSAGRSAAIDPPGATDGKPPFPREALAYVAWLVVARHGRNGGNARFRGGSRLIANLTTGKQGGGAGRLAGADRRGSIAPRPALDRLAADPAGGLPPFAARECPEAGRAEQTRKLENRRSGGFKHEGDASDADARNDHDCKPGSGVEPRADANGSVAGDAQSGRNQAGRGANGGASVDVGGKSSTLCPCPVDVNEIPQRGVRYGSQGPRREVVGPAHAALSARPVRVSSGRGREQGWPVPAKCPR
jgi:hypothetical protein